VPVKTPDWEVCILLLTSQCILLLTSQCACQDP
jgi:hypothetical protein